MLQVRRLSGLLMLAAITLSLLYLGKSGLPQISHVVAPTVYFRFIW